MLRGSLCAALASVALAVGSPTSATMASVVHGVGCWVPKLVGKTLPQVRHAYRARRGVRGGWPWCKVGSISGDRDGVVVWQSPRPRRLLHKGVAVKIRLR